MIHTPNFCRVNQISRRTNKTTVKPDSPSDYFSSEKLKGYSLAYSVYSSIVLVTKFFLGAYNINQTTNKSCFKKGLFSYQSKLTMTTDVKQCWYWTWVNVFSVLPELYISSTSLWLQRGHIKILNLHKLNKKFVSSLLIGTYLLVFLQKSELEAWSLYKVPWCVFNATTILTMKGNHTYNPFVSIIPTPK